MDFQPATYSPTPLNNLTQPGLGWNADHAWSPIHVGIGTIFYARRG